MQFAAQQHVRPAWLALRGSRTQLPNPPQSAATYTGYSVRAACEKLAGAGLLLAEAEQAVHEAILLHFPAFANSWDSYIDNNGWVWDLLRMPEDQRSGLGSEYDLADLLDTAGKAQRDPMAILADPQAIGRLMQLSARLQRDQDRGRHPARELMQTRFGLHPELALAVLKHSRVVPWWVLLVLPFFISITGGLFALALTDPQNEIFKGASGGGVGPLHYIVLPLFCLLFLAVLIWMIVDKPRREREWRQQLAKYQAAWDAEHLKQPAK